MFREDKCSAVENVSSWCVGEEGKETNKRPHTPHEKDGAGVHHLSPRLVDLSLAEVTGAVVHCARGGGGIGGLGGVEPW